LPQVHEQRASNRPSNCTHDSTLHRAIYNALCEMLGVPNMAHITANDLKTRGIAAIEASLAGGRTEAVVSVRGTERYVVMELAQYQHLRECELEAALAESRAEIAEGHLARVRAINAAAAVEGVVRTAKTKSRKPSTSAPRKAVRRRVG
jgi:hypothetical protein